MNDYSKTYRILHWLLAITFLLLLFTIFLRLTWLNKYNVSEIIMNYLSSNDIVLNKDQAIILAKKIREPMWNWHIYLGYFLTFLFSIRFIIPFWGEMKIQNPLDNSLSGKEKLQRWIYILFYIFVVISLVTGLLIELGPKSIKHTMESVHVLSIYYLIGYIVLHIGGVLLAEFTDRKGILSRIVSGSK